MNRWAGWLCFLVSAAASAQEPPTNPTPTPSIDARALGSLEAQIGLQLFAEEDDYRAVSSLKRFRILDPEAGEFLGSLLIAEIYRRNDHAAEAVGEFERAAQAAPTREEAVWAKILANSVMCVPLRYYLKCASTLREMSHERLPESQRELAAYQRLFADVVLRQPLTASRLEVFKHSELREHGAELLRLDRAFDDLPTQSPALAGILSGVIPGAGQLYNGRPVDGMLALLLVGISGAATWYAWDELESLPLTIAGGVFTVGFYAGNVTNAVVDAHRINAETYRNFFEDLQRRHWARPGFEVRQNTVKFGWKFEENP